MRNCLNVHVTSQELDLHGHHSFTNPDRCEDS